MSIIFLSPWQDAFFIILPKGAVCKKKD